ncbi:hypothetical protein NDU88_005361 [Pleurodeles waltl]|uniref:Uncharacterized protein n=1 Tax=Pleurodeles waltl TaxID=8319 RepID=A0AAV7VJM7_PLEWA|nr:hypothetical protein NDU88_005361 [Pleurodeles waltl]
MEDTATGPAFEISLTEVKRSIVIGVFRIIGWRLFLQWDRKNKNTGANKKVSGFVGLWCLSDYWVASLPPMGPEKQEHRSKQKGNSSFPSVKSFVRFDSDTRKSGVGDSRGVRAFPWKCPKAPDEGRERRQSAGSEDEVDETRFKGVSLGHGE